MSKISPLISIQILANMAFPIALYASQDVDAQEFEEILVTARRKEDRLQTVPMSVTAISAQEIEFRGVKNFADIAFLDPSVIIDQGFSAEDTRIAIRGLSDKEFSELL